MKDFRMVDLQNRINKLFDDFAEEEIDDSKFLINLERLTIIERVLVAKNYKELKRVRKMLNYIIRFEYQNKSLHKKMRRMRKIMEFTINI